MPVELSREKKWNNIKLSILISKSLYWVGFDRAAVVWIGLWKLKRNDELGEENKKTFRVTQQQLEILSTPPDTQSDRGAGHSGRGEVRKTTRPSLVFKGGTPIRITKEINVISIESLSCCYCWPWRGRGRAAKKVSTFLWFVNDLESNRFIRFDRHWKSCYATGDYEEIEFGVPPPPHHHWFFFLFSSDVIGTIQGGINNQQDNL